MQVNFALDFVEKLAFGSIYRDNTSSVFMLGNNAGAICLDLCDWEANIKKLFLRVSIKFREVPTRTITTAFNNVPCYKRTC